jgi:probable phosphoglycerate mutase
VAITTELVIARHGEAVCNTTGIVGGDKGCTGLSQRGRRQAAQLAVRLKADHTQRAFDVLLCSPRLRVRQSAAAVADELDLTIVVEKDLRGPDHGTADGRPWAQVKAEFGSALQHQPHKLLADGADSWNTYLARATSTLEQILKRHHGQRILIVAHGETIEAAHTLLLGLPAGASERIWFPSGHTGISRWQLQVNIHGRATWLLDTHNDTSHLHSAG